MASKQEKENRKKILNQIREKEKEKFVQTLPVAKEHFINLFDYLDEKSEEEKCDHSLKFTKEFCEENDLNFEKIASWLREHGGYCDCEVIMNVVDQFEGL